MLAYSSSPTHDTHGSRYNCCASIYCASVPVCLFFCASVCRRVSALASLCASVLVCARACVSERARTFLYGHASLHTRTRTRTRTLTRTRTHAHTLHNFISTPPAALLFGCSSEFKPRGVCADIMEHTDIPASGIKEAWGMKDVQRCVPWNCSDPGCSPSSSGGLVRHATVFRRLAF